MATSKMFSYNRIVDSLHSCTIDGYKFLLSHALTISFYQRLVSECI